ncbi:microtubule associated protein-domain-containing protein [Phycomyces blakesleeanus]
MYSLTTVTQVRLKTALPCFTISSCSNSSPILYPHYNSSFVESLHPKLDQHQNRQTMEQFHSKISSLHSLWSSLEALQDASTVDAKLKPVIDQLNLVIAQAHYERDLLAADIEDILASIEESCNILGIAMENILASDLSNGLSMEYSQYHPHRIAPSYSKQKALSALDARLSSEIRERRRHVKQWLATIGRLATELAESNSWLPWEAYYDDLSWGTVQGINCNLRDLLNLETEHKSRFEAATRSLHYSWTVLHHIPDKQDPWEVALKSLFSGIKVDTNIESGPPNVKDAAEYYQKVMPTPLSLAPEALHTLEDKARRANDMYKSQLDTYHRLTKRVRAIWDELCVSEDQRCQLIPSLEPGNIQKIQAELDSFKDIVKKMTDGYISVLKVRLDSLWDTCLVNKSEREAFIAKLYEEASTVETTRVIVDEHIAYLKTIQHESSTVSELMKQRKELVQKMIDFEKNASDPKRLFQASFQLLDEERWRNTCFPTLVRLDNELIQAVHEFERISHKPFMYNDRRYLDILAEEIADRSANQTFFGFMNSEPNNRSARNSKTKQLSKARPPLSIYPSDTSKRNTPSSQRSLQTNALVPSNSLTQRGSTKKVMPSKRKGSPSGTLLERSPSPSVEKGIEQKATASKIPSINTVVLDLSISVARPATSVLNEINISQDVATSEIRVDNSMANLPTYSISGSAPVPPEQANKSMISGKSKVDCPLSCLPVSPILRSPSPKPKTNQKQAPAYLKVNRSSLPVLSTPTHLSPEQPSEMCVDLPNLKALCPSLLLSRAFASPSSTDQPNKHAIKPDTKTTKSVDIPKSNPKSQSPTKSPNCPADEYQAFLDEHMHKDKLPELKLKADSPTSSCSSRSSCSPASTVYDSSSLTENKTGECVDQQRSRTGTPSSPRDARSSKPIKSPSYPDQEDYQVYLIEQMLKGTLPEVKPNVSDDYHPFLIKQMVTEKLSEGISKTSSQASSRSFGKFDFSSSLFETKAEKSVSEVKPRAGRPSTPRALKSPNYPAEEYDAFLVKKMLKEKLPEFKIKGASPTSSRSSRSPASASASSSYSMNNIIDKNVAVANDKAMIEEKWTLSSSSESSPTPSRLPQEFDSSVFSVESETELIIANKNTKMAKQNSYPPASPSRTPIPTSSLYSTSAKQKRRSKIGESKSKSNSLTPSQYLDQERESRRQSQILQSFTQ